MTTVWPGHDRDELTADGKMDAEGDMPAKRTTHRSASGKKLYAVRDKSGKFKDVQTYKRAQGSDVKRKSKSESKSRKKK
jgi:uncharacterized protein YjhX (UPF0386 family)